MAKSVVPTGRYRAFARAGRFWAVLVLFTSVLALASCKNDDKNYDIGPIFPLTANKCAKYDGKASGSGLGQHCYVSKGKCEQAAADWREATRGQPDAIQFTC